MFYKREGALEVSTMMTNLSRFIKKQQNAIVI